MKTRSLLILVAIIVVGGAVAGWVIARRQASTPVANRQADVRPAPATSQPVVTTATEPVPVEETAVPANPVRQPNATSQPIAVTPAAVTYPEYLPLDSTAKEELGRASLSYVGADAVADEVWASLIYDDTLSDSVREDLMEDLNENGFSAGDGRTATVEDLPLIEARIEMLEEHMYGADDFMLEHLAEAHKDLVNMWFTLTGR